MTKVTNNRAFKCRLSKFTSFNKVSILIYKTEPRFLNTKVLLPNKPNITFLNKNNNEGDECSEDVEF